MRYTELIFKVEELESIVGLKAISYGPYSVDRRAYIKGLYPKNNYEVDYFANPYRYKYSFREVGNMVQFLLEHHGAFYCPAHQSGCNKHGFKIQFDLEEIRRLHVKTIAWIVEEPNGQTAFKFV